MENKNSEAPLEILLVEDDEFDVHLTDNFLKHGQFKFHLSVVNDGESALEFLKKESSYNNVPTPDLIILDMGLPKMDGREVLKQIRKKPDLKHIPVIILTGQQLEGDPVKDLKLHEHAYINKWLQMDDLKSLIKAVEDYRRFRSEEGAN